MTETESRLERWSDEVIMISIGASSGAFLVASGFDPTDVMATTILTIAGFYVALRVDRIRRADR